MRRMRTPTLRRPRNEQKKMRRSGRSGWRKSSSPSSSFMSRSGSNAYGTKGPRPAARPDGYFESEEREKMESPEEEATESRAAGRERGGMSISLSSVARR